MDALAANLLTVADWITAHITMWALIATGLFLTVITRAVQVRHLPDMFRQVVGSRSGAEDGISSFQAFAISLAARVGVGNVFGVAAALLMGGPGAIFWMWVVALVGMATAFFEATLAQVFKVRAADGTFRGGPAFYMAGGMRSKALGGTFAVITVLTCGLVITSVQSNAFAGTLVEAFGSGESALPGFGGITAAQLVVAALTFVLTAVVVFGGIRSVARVTEWMAPIMALVYVVLVFFICLTNLGSFFDVIGQILRGAFAPQPILGGLGGGIMAAVVNGTKRGLFSNEAGQGTAPNAAATATVTHPVQQGFIQSLGVFIDTIVVCTATAFVILIAGPDTWTSDGANPANLTTLAISHELGGWTVAPMAVLIFVLAYSSIIAAYVYSDVNMSFLTGGKRWASWLVRWLCALSATAGAVLSLDVVWNAVDIAMAIMTLTNLVALIALSRWGIGALKDYEAQRAAGVAEPVFHGSGNRFLPADVPGDVWSGTPEATQPAAVTGAER